MKGDKRSKMKKVKKMKRITVVSKVVSKGEESYCFVIYMFVITLGLAFLFLYLQFVEYRDAYFGISDGIYGTTFYMVTGFHGFHVLVGVSFLFICFCRFACCHFLPDHHVGLEAAIWYWHFVDVVWIFLFLSVYVWGNYGALDMNVCYVVMY